MNRFVKSILSVNIILTLILSACMPAFAMDTSRIQMLENMGVLSSDTLSDNAVVSRGEFLKMVTTLLFENVEDLSFGSVPFIDVSEDDKYYQYISVAYGYGLISGSGNGYFYPGEPMKYIDAVKIMTNALGYGTAVNLDNGYVKGYADIATRIKLTNKAYAIAQNELTISLAKELLHDSLEVYMANASSFDEDEITLEKSNVTLMDSLGIRYVTGVLSANEYTGFYNLNGTEQNAITVGNVTAYIYNSMDDEKYIGYEVICYYREVDNKNIVLSLEPTSSNEAVVIASDDYIDYNSGVIRYHKNEKRDDEVRLADRLFVIYNGRVKDDYTNETFALSDGTITAIDNSGDGRADVINIRSFDNYIVTGIDSVDKIIYDRYGRTLDLQEDTGKSIIISDINGQEIFFDKLAKDQILSVMADENQKYIRIIASSESIKGSISDITDDNKITIDNSKEYALSSNIPEAELPEYKRLSQKGTFYIDAFGKIAYFKKDASGPLYSMIIAKDPGAWNRDAAFKFIDVNSAIRVGNISKNCKLNGVKVSSPVDICNAVSVNELVIIVMNSNGEISSVETSEGDVLHAINEKGSLSYSGGPRWFGQKLTITSTTPVFVYPKDSSDENRYFVWDYNYLVEGSLTVQAFNTDKNSFLPDIITVSEITNRKNFVKYNSTNAVVKGITHGIDAQGEDIGIMEVLTFGGEARKYKLPMDIYQTLTVVPGDIVKFNLDRLGVIRGIDKVYDSEKQVIDSGSKYVSASVTAGFKPMVGYVYEWRNSVLGFSALAEGAGYNDVTYYPISSATVSVLEKDARNNVTIKSGNVNMLTDYVSSGNPSKIFIYTKDGILQKIIILK